MPKYTNNGLSVIEKNGVRLEIGESKIVKDYWQTLPTGVVEDDSVGYFDPILSSTKVTSTSTVTVPVTTSSYEVKIYCSTGEATIQYNNASAVEQYIGAGETLREKCFSRIIDSIIITVSSGTVYVTIREV